MARALASPPHWSQRRPLAEATRAAKMVRMVEDDIFRWILEGKKKTFIDSTYKMGLLPSRIHRKMSSSTVLTVFAALVASANGLLWLQWGGDANARAYE
ncbi:unnamed protein product [Caenorhabditis auriculariae]|uniref:Uncharacterized protein n=1 Tax=Caenorhabditis auriculariae TaxID=2777116 RepID=A0A8S1H916_9PELO|nr:unnamed protein product [Caenorhabditis auriculariae]